MATPEKPKKSVSFAVERPREEEIKRDTKSLFIVRQRPEVFADSKLIRPKFSSPSMNLSTMYLNASDESDSAESESEDMEEEEVLEVALKSEDSMDVDQEHSNTSSSWQPFEPIIESPEPEPEVEPDPEPMIVEYSPASESGIIRKYVVSEVAMQEGSPSDSSVGIAPPSPGSSSSNLSNSSSATPSYSGSRSGSSTSNDSKTTEHSSITASSTTTDRTDLSSRTGQSIESSLTSGTYSSYTSGRTGTSGTTYSSYTSGRTGTSGTTYSSYTTDMTHSTMTTGSTMPSFGSSEFSTDAYTSTLTGSLSRSDSGSRTESATTESKYSTSNAKSSSDTVISAQVPQSEGPAETKRRKAHEVEPPTPSSASEQSYSSQTSETEGKSMTVPPPNSSKYVSEVIEPQITQAQMAQIGQGRIAADDGKLTVGSFHSAESKFSYTTPSILLEKKEIEEANDSLLDYTTPSRLHQKIISRDINEKPHITESIKSYTTPSALFRKKEEIEGVDSLQDNKTATTLVEQTVGREQIERVALQSPTSNIKPSQISTENDKIAGEPPHIRGTHGSHITPSSSSSSVEVVPEPERTEHTLDPNFGEKYPYLQKTLGAKDSSPNEEFKMSFKKSDTSSSGHVTRKEKEETYGTQMDESGRKSTTATPQNSVTPASSFDFVTDSDLPSPAQAEFLFRRASSGPVYQESSSGTLPDVYTESDESMPPRVSFVSAPTPTIPYDSELDVEVDSRAQSYDICLPTNEQATQEKAETKTVPLKAQSVYVSPVKRHIYGSINQPYSLPSVPVYSVMHRMPAAGDLHHKRPEFLHDYVTEALTLDKTKGVVGKIIPTVIDMEISTDETEREQQEAEGESKRQIGETDLKTDSKQMADKDLEINQQTDRNGQQERSDDSDEIETVERRSSHYFGSAEDIIRQQTEEIHRLIWELYKAKARMSDTSTEDTDDDTHDERLKLVIKELEETHGLLEVKDLEIDAMQEKMKELKAIAEDKQGQLLSTQEELNEMQNLAEERLEHIQVLKEHFIEVHSTLNSDTDVASSHEILLSTSDGTISEEAVAIASSSLNHISRLQDELQEAQHIIEVKNRHIEVLLNTINADEETDMTKSKVGRQQSSKQDKDVKLTIENELLEAKVEIEYLREELLQNKKLAGDRGKEIKSLQQNYESVQKQLQSRHNLIESLNNQVENVTMMLETKVSENEDLKSLLNAQIEGKESANHEDLLRKDREIEQLRREVDISKTLAEQRKGIIWNLQNKQGKNDADDESTYDVKLQSKIDGFKALLESKDSMIKNLESKLADIHLAKTESDPSVLNRIEHMEGLLKLKEADNEALQREVLAIRKLAGHRLHDINSLTRKYSALKQTENNSDSLTKTLQLQLQNLSMVLIARDDEIERLRIELKSVTDGQKQHDKVSSSMDEQYTALQDELKATKVDNEALERELLYSRKLAEQRSQEINSLSRKHSTTEQVANDSKTLAKNLQLQMRGLISQLETKDQKIAEIQSKLAEANKSLAVASLSSQQMNVEAAIHKADSKDFVDSMTMKLYELRKVISDHLVTITSLKSELQQSKKSSGEKDAQIQMIMNETRDHQIELEKRIEKMQEQLESMANKTGDQKIDSVIRLLQDDLIIAKSELHKKEHELEKRISDHGRETQILQNQLQHMSQELGNSSFYSSQKYRDMRELFENQLSEACKTAKENCEKYDTLVKDSENVKQELQKRIEELELQLIKTQSTKVLAESNTQAGINHRKDLECELIKSEQQRLQLEMEIQQLQKQLPISESQKAAIAMQAELSSGADGINMAEQHLLQGVRNDSTSILINSLKNELLSQKNELRKKNDDVDQMMKSHESDSKVLRSQIEILKQQLQQVSQQSKMDRTDEKELESLQRYQNIMKESDKEKQQLQKDIQDLQLQLVKAEAKANTQVLIDSDISLKKEVEHAKELLAEKDVQLKQLVKESQQQYADMQKEIQLLQIKQIESGAEIVDHGKDNAITALQQELAIARKVIKEKDDHLQLVTQESQKQLSELQRQLQEMYVKSVDTRHVADANKDALHEMQHIKDELAILRSSTKDSTENSVLKVQFDNVKQEYGRHLKELETLREDYISTKRLSSERRRKIENVEEELAEMKDLAKSQNMNERALLEELTVIKSLVDVKEKQNNALQENLDSSRFALKQQEDNIAKMRQQIEELQETVKEKKQKINLLSANQQQSQNTFQKMASDRLAIMQKAEAAKSTIHTQKQRIESLEKTVDEANRNVEQKQREIDTLRDNLKVANKTACERSHALVQMKGNVADVGVLADDRQRQTMELLEDLENKETLTREQQIQIKMLKQDVTRTHQTVKDKNREIWQLKQELDDATDIALFRETESTNIHSEFEETKRLAEDRKRQVESLDKLLEDSQLSVQTKDSENVNLQQELARSESISLEQKQEIGTLKDKVQSLTGTVHDLSRQNKESNDKLRSSSRVLADQEKKIQQMEAQLKDIRAKFDEKDRELDNIAHNMDISMNVAEERLNKLKAMAQEIKNLHKEIKDRDKSIKTLQHELHSLKSHSENKERKAEALSGKTEGFKRLAEERGSQVSSLQKDLETLKEIARNKQGQLDSIQDSLIKQTAEYKSQNEQVTQLLNQKNSMEERLQTLTNDLQNNAKELATAKEINQTLFYDKCKSESERKQSEDELIAVRHLLESEKDVHRAEMAAINSELQQSKEHIRNAERTKEQLTTTLDEVKEQLTEDLNRANRKSEKLGNQLADCEAELGLLKNNYNLVCSALETERKDVEALKRQCKLAEDTRYALEEKVKDLTIYVETSKLTIDAGKEQFEMLEREKQSLLGDIHSMQETLTEKERLISETKVTCQQSIEDLNRKHQQKLLQGDKIRGDIQCRFDELQERCEVLKTQVEKRNVQLVNYGKTLRDLDSTRSSNKELENRIDGLEAELEKTRLLVKDTKAELANKEQSLENATQALAKSKNVNGDLREELKRQRLTAAKAIGDKDKEKSELDQTLTNIKSSLEDTKWNCSTLTNSNALLESDKRHLADTVDRLQNELKTETQHRILAEKVAADREFEIKEYKRDQDLLHENLGKLRDDIGKLERLLQEEKKRIDRLKNEKESLKSLASVMDSRASGLVQKINHYQSELTKTRKKMQSRCRTLKEEDEQVILDLHDKLNVLQEEKEKNSEQLCKTMKELEETRDHTFKKNEQCHKLKKTVSELENEKKDLKFDLKKAEDALKVETALQERLSLRNQELESELVRLRNALGKLQEQSMLHQHQSPSASTAKDQSSELRTIISELSKQIKKQANAKTTDNSVKDKCTVSQLQSDLNREKTFRAVEQQQLRAANEEIEHLRDTLNKCNARKTASSTPERSPRRRLVLDDVTQIVADSQTRAAQTLALQQSMMGSSPVVSPLGVSRIGMPPSADFFHSTPLSGSHAQQPPLSGTATDAV